MVREDGAMTVTSCSRPTCWSARPIFRVFLHLSSSASWVSPGALKPFGSFILDVSTNERLSLLRRAESLGRLRVREAGDVFYDFARAARFRCARSKIGAPVCTMCGPGPNGSSSSGDLIIATNRNSKKILAHPTGFEPVTSAFGARPVNFRYGILIHSTTR
jgi:hypothetical protein